MKRIAALLLAVLLLAALSMAPAMAEGREAAAQGDGGAPLTEQGGQEISSGTLRFSQLREVLEENNNSIKALRANLEDLKDQDTGELEDAVDQLEQLVSGIRATQAAVQQALGTVEGQLGSLTPPGEGQEEGYQSQVSALRSQQLILTALNLTLTADTVSLQSQIATLEAQLDSIDLTIETTRNTLNDAINQIVKGTETLYVGIATMEASLDDLQRGMEAMDRAVAIYEKQYELGMVSQYEVETMEHQRTTLASQMDTLLFQVKSNKVTLEGMCGLSLQGNVRLTSLPIPTAEEVGRISYERDMAAGQKRNVDVLNAEAELDADDSDAKRYELQAAKDTFAYQFKNLCLTVEEKQRLVGVAEETLAFQERTFAITEKQYELGMISQEEYLSGQNDLYSAQTQVETAQLELFTAYRDYIWARDYGLI